MELEIWEKEMKIRKCHYLQFKFTEKYLVIPNILYTFAPKIEICE